jgi:hypothetical protein
MTVAGDEQLQQSSSSSVIVRLMSPLNAVAMNEGPCSFNSTPAPAVGATSMLLGPAVRISGGVVWSQAAGHNSNKP